MVVLENDHNFSSILCVIIFASVADKCLELQVRDLKLGVEVNALSPVSKSKITSHELTAILVGAPDFEGTAQRRGRILEGSCDGDR